jgi:hypothetical protein
MSLVIVITKSSTQGAFKKRPNFCYKDLILQHFKPCPLQSCPLYWRYAVPNVPSIVGMLSGTHFLWRRAVILSHFPESSRVHKRPNFLNSYPTSREDAIRLLSSPRGRFWQQTAICPVSLWALVVELYPLNWARAQAVRRINPTNNLFTCLLASYLRSSVFFRTQVYCWTSD